MMYNTYTFDDIKILARSDFGPNWDWPKNGVPMLKMMGLFLGRSKHGTKPLCQILAL